MRIQALKQTTESLDETLKSTIRLLADARQEILAIPSSGSTEESKNEVKVDELLAYAKFISRTTVPPTFRKHDIQPVSIKSEDGKPQTANGIRTPPSGAEESQTVLAENVGLRALNVDAKKFIDPLKDLPFEPWPSHDIIQRGALAEIQRMIEAGQDPSSVLTPEEQAEADRRKEENEEVERRAQEDAERRRMSMFDTGAMRRRPTVEVFDPDNL